MDSVIYDYLAKYNDEIHDHSLLLDCLLILSTNGIFISYDQLLNYCESNNDETVSSTMHGLNQQQFQIINNYMKSLKNNINNNNINNKVIKHHDISFNNKQIKSDCSIVIIIENNLNHEKSIIKPEKSNYNKYIIDRNSTPFYKLWRNVIIKREILFHLRLYNIHYNRPFKTMASSLSNYRYKSYLNNVILLNEQFRSNNVFQDYSLPDSINSIKFNISFNQSLEGIITPYSSLTSITFGSNFNHSLDGNWLPRNLKSLEFGNFFQQSIKVGHLPTSLTSLKFSERYFDGIIEPDSIPSSVTTLDYKFNSDKNQNLLISYPIPKYITRLEFDDRFNQDIFKYQIPHNIAYIQFGTFFNGIIEPNALPLSVGSLNFINPTYVLQIEHGTLPPNLTSFKGNYNCSVDVPVQSILPFSSLKSLVVGQKFNRIKELEHYQKLEILDLRSIEQQVLSINLLPITLRSLDIGIYNGEITQLIHLSSLTHLKWCMKDETIVEFSNLPSTITTLELYGNLNKPLYKFGKIPNSITSLSFSGSLLFDIESDCDNLLPSNLKTLYLTNPKFNQDLSIDCLLPSTLDSIFIDPNNKNLIHKLPLYIFTKYIKFLNVN